MQNKTQGHAAEYFTGILDNVPTDEIWTKILIF